MDSKLLQRFCSVYDWCVYKKLPIKKNDIPGIKNTIPDDWMDEYRIVYRHLWEKHVQLLKLELRIQFTNGSHPSLDYMSTDKTTLVKQTFGEFKRKIDNLAYVVACGLGAYYDGSLVFAVDVLADTPWNIYAKEIPDFFEGFKVIIGGNTKAEDKLKTL